MQNMEKYDVWREVGLMNLLDRDNAGRSDLSESCLCCNHQKIRRHGLQSGGYTLCAMRLAGIGAATKKGDPTITCRACEILSKDNAPGVTFAVNHVCLVW